MSAKDTHQRFEAVVEHALKDQGLKANQFKINSVAKPGGKIAVTVKLGRGLGSTEITKALTNLAASKGFELIRE